MRWILKRFWFPILMIALGLLGRKYPWAAKAHVVITKVADPVIKVRGVTKKYLLSAGKQTPARLETR